MIRKKAIQQFLDRARRDLRWWKDLSDAELDDRMWRLPVAPPIWYKLRREQKVCFLIGAKYGRFAFWLDTGLGKTLLTIALVKYFRRDVTLLNRAKEGHGEFKAVLVLVPNKINKDEWEREIRKHSPDLPYLILRGSSEDKWAALRERTAPAIVVETYGGLSRMLCPLVTVKRKGKRAIDKLVPEPGLIEDLLDHIDGVFLDESNSAGNHQALPFRLCWQLSKQLQHFFVMAGTPFGRDPTPLWAQMKLIDGGASLGETLGLFRSALFRAKPNHYGGFDYTFDRQQTKTLNRLLAHNSIRYEVEQSTLPALVHIIKEVGLEDDAYTYYERARAALKAAKGNVREIRNVFLRMRQISSGFLGYADDDTGEKAKYEFPDNPKLDMLMALIETIREDRKIVVYHDFIWSGDKIAAGLAERGIGYVKVGGGSKIAPGLLDRFSRDPKIRVFVLSTAGAYGLNLQAAQYGIFFESPVSVITRKQMIRRIERQYSEHVRVFLYDLVSAGTMDQRILDFYAAGVDLFEAIIKGKVAL